MAAINHPAFSRDSLIRGLKPAIVVLLLCIFVWIWGNHRSVSVEMTMRPQINSFEKPRQLDMTMYYSDTDKVAASFSVPCASDRLAVHTVSLPPGDYSLRGILTTVSGKTHIVKQSITVPDENASIEIYLRE